MEEKKYQYYMEDLTNEDGSKWHQFVDYALERADVIEFSAPLDEKQWSPRLIAMLPWLQERFESHWRWQVRQQKARTVVRIKKVPEVVALLRIPQTLQDTLFMQPAFPEDPAFYVNGTAILWTITHEVWAYALLTESEAALWREKGFFLDVAYENTPPTRREE